MTTPVSPTPVRALIVDDEPLARSDLRRMLRPYPEILVLEECDCGSAALAAVARTAAELLFLDVQMPEGDGFAVAEHLAGRALPAIVFVTAYDQYALRAFDTGAVDYLLKPFDAARLERTLRRTLERVAIARSTPQPPPRLIVRNAGEVSFVDVTEIDWIESADYYACVHVGSQTHILRRSLGDLETELDAAGFVRIHRSTIVNRQRVARLAANSDGDYDVHLIDGTQLRLSRRYRSRALELLGVRKLP